MVLTHLHVDHVGGATVLADGAWRPAFPTARHIVGAAELEDARRKAHLPDPPDDADMIFGDSVAPLERAGLLEAVDLPAILAPDLTLEAAPGHTLGHAMLRLRAEGDEALFTGDVAHSILQLLDPDLNTVFCEHPDLARRTRRAVLEEAAARGVLLLPQHFGHAAPLRVRRDGRGFRPERVAPPPREAAA